METPVIHHTLPPWWVCGGRKPGTHRIFARHKNGTTAIVCGSVNPGDAEIIVRSVNMHEELVSLLMRALPLIDNGHNGLVMQNEIIAAIAKAKGGHHAVS